MNLYVNTYGTAQVKLNDSEIAVKIEKLFDMRPKAIEERLKLRNPIYKETASYGHMGRTPELKAKCFKDGNNNLFTQTVELFTWEKTDKVADIKAEFGL